MKKHLTKAEREARESAEESVTRETRVKVQAPGWLSESAAEIFLETRKKMRGLGILDNVDADLLAMYADALARYRTAIESLSPLSDPKEHQAAQAWSRLALSYAEKLGISPTARARLARQKAQKPPEDPMEELLDNPLPIVQAVQDFVNEKRNDK